MAASAKHGNGWSFAMRLWSYRRALPDLDIELSRLLYEFGRCAALRPWVTPCRYWTSSSCLCPSPGGVPRPAAVAASGSSDHLEPCPA